MILPDVNVFVYALHSGAPQHKRAKDWLQAALVGDEEIALWDVSLVSTYRLLTNPNLEAALSAPEDVLAAIDQIRAAPASVPIAPGPQFWETFSRTALATNMRGPKTSDAMLAALAIEHRCRVATYDSDFGRFPGLQWFRP
jgi:uncharacterized protein